MRFHSALWLVCAVIVALVAAVHTSSPTMAGPPHPWKVQLRRAMRDGASSDGAPAPDAYNVARDAALDLPQKKERSLAASCAACASFSTRLHQLVSNEAVTVAADASANDDSPSVAISAANHENRQLCEKLGDAESVAACRNVADVYGLENTLEVLAAAPDLICEAIKACDYDRAMLSDETVANHLQDASDVLVSSALSDKLGTQVGFLDFMHDPSPGALHPAAGAADQQGADAAAVGTGATEGASAGNVVKAMHEMQKHNLYSYASMKLMQDQQMAEQLVQNMMHKMQASVERNRELKMEYIGFMKQAYRNTPGNCDCCDACLPPKHS